MTQAVIRHNPRFKQYYQKKRAEGMPYRKAGIATLNKLFRVIFALLRKNETFREKAITIVDSSFRKRLGAETFYDILHHLIAQAIAIGLIKNLIHTAVDATHIWAFSSKFGIRICTCKGKCDCLRNYADKDAQRGHKTKT